MPQKLKKILCVDIESTCYDDVHASGGLETKADPISEIIEIGIGVLDLLTKEIVKHDYFVKPEFSTVSEYCTNLTGITQMQVDQGLSFYQSCEILRGLGSKTWVWASWGDYDRNQFMRQTDPHNPGYPYRQRPAYPFGPGHINVKNLYGIMKSLDKGINLDEACKAEFPTEGFIGRLHNGADDAFNVARILRKLLLER